jgi:hypothetical protein
MNHLNWVRKGRVFALSPSNLFGGIPSRQTFLLLGCEDSEVRSLIPNELSSVPCDLCRGWHSILVEHPVGILIGLSLSSFKWILAQLGMRLGV